MFKTFVISMIVLFSTAESLKAQSLRERIKERMKERKESQGTPAPGVVQSLTIKAQERKYLLHVPASYKKDKSTALVVAFHGGGGSMEQAATDKFYNLISKSDKEGFIIVFPNGNSKRSNGKLATWNAGLCCGHARDNNLDDVGFIRELVKKIEQDYSIDKSMIFAVGMSNGGMMSYRLACEMPDVFKAIASVAGTDNTSTCNPGRAVSVLHIHAKNDDHVLFNGGAGKGSLFKSQVNDFVSVPATISKWVKLNGCQEKSENVLKVEGATCELYSGCKDNTHIKLCVTESGGHSWPGGIKDRAQEPPSKAISATDMMWDFFKGVYK